MEEGEVSKRFQLLRIDLDSAADVYAAEHDCTRSMALSEVVSSGGPVREGYTLTLSEQAPEVARVCGAEIVTEMRRYAEEHRVSLGEALSEIIKRNPRRWQKYSEALMMPTREEINRVSI
jgi:hypothetical protein